MRASAGEAGFSSTRPLQTTTWSQVTSSPASRPLAPAAGGAPLSEAHKVLTAWHDNPHPRLGESAASIAPSPETQ